METFARNITDLAADERVAIEQFLGTHLTEHQRIIVEVMDAGADNGNKPPRRLHAKTTLHAKRHTQRPNTLEK